MGRIAEKRIRKFKGFLKFHGSFIFLRYTKFYRSYLKSYFKSHSASRLHIGCGHVMLRDWLNIYFDKAEIYGGIKTVNGAKTLNYNLLKPWPFEDNSVEYIAGSHIIEHLNLNEGIEFLKEAFRVLNKGGVIRLSCPDLYLYARNYVENKREFFDNELIREWCAFRCATTSGEIFIAKAYDSGGSHKWFYDLESLNHILELAGFSKISRETRLTGKVPDLERIELPRREIETIYVEAFKL